MSNFFDQFDEKRDQGGNFFDQFDAPAAEPDSVRAYGASLKNLPASVKFAFESGLAKPVDAAAGVLDSISGLGNLLNPVNLARAQGAAVRGEGRQAVEALGEGSSARIGSRSAGFDDT